MTIKPFTTLTGTAAPLPRANIDTDVIIRIEHLTRLSKEGLGPHGLAALRYLADGSEDPAFVLNQPAFRNAPILLTGPNFGCGSSREHAVWALQGLGVRCIIGPSFGDIFYANCFQNGLLPIRLPLEETVRLARQCAGGSPLRVDLNKCEIAAPDGSVSKFTIDSRRREMLMLGLDEIGLTLLHAQEIMEWQTADRALRPWAWPLQNWSVKFGKTT